MRKRLNWTAWILEKIDWVGYNQNFFVNVITDLDGEA